MTANLTPVGDAEPGDVLCRLLDISAPVLQAGMAGISGPALAAAVSNAGGLGHLGGLRQSPKALRRMIQATREQTDRPFGVNLVPAFGGPEVFEAQLRVVLEEKPRVLSLFYGDFLDVIPRVKSEGIVVGVQVGSVKEARRVWDQGADIVIAQGVESGGHIRGTVALHPFLSALREYSDGRPVVAAGGIVTARDVRSVLSLGPQGVWVGTAFVVALESSAHDVYRRRIVEATTDDTEFRQGYSFGWKYGAFHRVIPSRRSFNPFNLVGGGCRSVDKAEIGEKLALYCGQGCGRITAVRPAEEIFAELAEGFSSRRSRDSKSTKTSSAA